MDSSSILLITQQLSFVATIESIFENDSEEITVREDVGSIPSYLQKDPFDVIIIHESTAALRDVDIDAFVDSKEIRVPCIWVTAVPTLDGALEAADKGVFSYLPEPLPSSRLREHARTAIAQTQLERLLASTEERATSLAKRHQRMKAAASAKGLFTSDAVLDSFFELIFERAIDAYLDARQLFFILNRRNPEALAQHLRHDPIKMRLIQTIKKGVEVLWGTRNQFKSKQIADLRKDFEGVLKELESDSVDSTA